MSELNTNNMAEAVETEVPVVNEHSEVGLAADVTADVADVDAGSDLNVQTGGGGDGVRLGLEQPHIGGQAEVQGYNQEVGVADGWGNQEANIQEAYGHVENGVISDLSFKQTGGGGTGVRLGLDQPHISGQAEVQGYDSEPCGADVQTGGASPFNNITDPSNGQTHSIFSTAGKALLKSYVKAFKNVQAGGWAPVEGGADPHVSGALHDGIPNQGAEAVSTNLCERTFDAQQPMWDAVQLGGAGGGAAADDGDNEPQLSAKERYIQSNMRIMDAISYETLRDIAVDTRGLEVPADASKDDIKNILLEDDLSYTNFGGLE